MMIPSEMNTQIYFLTGGGVDIHPDNLTPNIEACQESLTMTSTHDDHHYEICSLPMSMTFMKGIMGGVFYEGFL
jgi:hypothetical protein